MSNREVNAAGMCATCQCNLQLHHHPSILSKQFRLVFPFLLNLYELDWFSFCARFRCFSLLTWAIPSFVDLPETPCTSLILHCSVNCYATDTVYIQGPVNDRQNTRSNKFIKSNSHVSAICKVSNLHIMLVEHTLITLLFHRYWSDLRRVIGDQAEKFVSFKHAG